MADFPYTLSPKKLKGFFSHIQAAGVPPRVTFEYLQRAGFKSSNDRQIISVLKFIGFISSSGAPTDRWSQYRDKARRKVVMANAVREAYADLFSTFPDAHRREPAALTDYFSPQTKGGKRVVTALVNTFSALCELADFGPSPEAKQEEKPAGERPAGARGFTVNINIQLQLPATEDASIYDNLFAALKKHLGSG